MASDNKTLKQMQWDSPREWLELIQQHHHDGNILCEKSPDNPVHCSCCSGNLHIAASHHNLPCKQCSPKSLQTKHTSQVQQHLSPSEGLSFSCSALTHMRLRDFEPLCSVHTEPIPVPLRQFCQGNEMHQTWTTHPGNVMEEGGRGHTCIPKPCAPRLLSPLICASQLHTEAFPPFSAAGASNWRYTAEELWKAEAASSYAVYFYLHY